MGIKTASVLPGIDEDRQDWLLCGGRSRDSAIVEESNFDAIVKILGGESETMEIHRFRHWGVGWIEEILVHPSRLLEVEAILDNLSAYPILDDSDFSEREQASVLPAWKSWGESAWRNNVVECCDLVPLGQAYEFLQSLDSQVTLEYHEQRGEKSGLEFGEDGPNFNFRYLDPRYSHFPDYYTRDELAAFIRAQRKAKVDGKKV